MFNHYRIIWYFFDAFAETRKFPNNSFFFFQFCQVHSTPSERDDPKHLLGSTIFAGILQILERQDCPHRRGSAVRRRECHPCGKWRISAFEWGCFRQKIAWIFLGICGHIYLTFTIFMSSNMHPENNNGSCTFAKIFVKSLMKTMHDRLWTILVMTSLSYATQKNTKRTDLICVMSPKVGTVISDVMTHLLSR